MDVAKSLLVNHSKEATTAMDGYSRIVQSMFLEKVVSNEAMLLTQFLGVVGFGAQSGSWRMNLIGYIMQRLQICGKVIVSLVKVPSSKWLDLF